ncbi:MAG: hypothetical protein ACREQY_00435, partial [Candidatus Binatia bacterium]
PRPCPASRGGRSTARGGRLRLAATRGTAAASQALGSVDLFQAIARRRAPRIGGDVEIAGSRF